jgi:hypothetical protein
MTMTTLAEFRMPIRVANDDAPLADVVSAHLTKRRMERFVMIGVAIIAALTLATVVLQGYAALQPIPDIVTFAARV